MLTEGVSRLFADNNGSCEWFQDLGVAPTYSYQKLSVRRNQTTGQYYGFVNGVQKAIGHYSGLPGTGMYAAADSESHDNCSDTYVDAVAATSPYHSLQAYVDTVGYSDFGQQYNIKNVYPGEDSLYSIAEPYGATTLVGSGPNPLPGGC